MSNGNLGSLVPVVYYDLIARVAAGSPFAFYALVWSGWNPLDSSASGWIVALLVFGGGYLFGTVLATLNLAFLGVWWPILRFVKDFGFGRSPMAAFRNAYQEMDRLHEAKSSEGGVLVKMEAGASLAESLASGSTVLFVFAPIPMSGSGKGLIWVLLFLTAILRRWLFFERLCSFARRESDP